MAIRFHYTAKDKDGNPVAGTVVAEDKERALNKIQELRLQGFVDISIDSAGDSKAPDSKKVSVSFAIIVAVMGLLGGAGYWHWTQTPTYSLKKIHQAIKTHDLLLFEKHVDLEGVITRFIDDVMTVPTKEMDSLSGALAMGMISALKPQMIKTAEVDVRRYVETGRTKEFAANENNEKDPQISVQGLSQSLGATWDSFKKVEYIKKEGKIAVAGFRYKHEDLGEDLTIEIKLRDKGGYWQVSEIYNPAKLKEKIQALATRRPNVSAAQADILSNIATALKLYQLDNGAFPSTSEGLNALSYKPREARNWNGPYLQDSPIDPWGHIYDYECPGIHQTQGYDLSSVGEDGQSGTADDITNWDQMSPKISSSDFQEQSVKETVAAGLHSETRKANENAIKSALRTLSSAAESYRAAQNPPSYPADITVLVSSDPPSYLDESWLPGNQPKYGYKIVYEAVADKFSALAKPSGQNQAVANIYCIDHTGIVVGSVDGKNPPTATTDGCAGGVAIGGG